MSASDISSEETNGKGLMKKLNNYIIVDVGANLTNKKFSRDLDAVIQRAKDAGEYKTSFDVCEFLLTKLSNIIINNHAPMFVLSFLIQQEFLNSW